MPLDTVVSLLAKGNELIFWIIDRLNKLKLAEGLIRRIKEHLEYIQLTIRKIKPYVQKNTDTEEIKTFLSHLENASKSCSGISDEHTLVKLATAPSVIIKLYNIEGEVKMASSKLLLFITSNNLMKFCSTADLQNEKLRKLTILQENDRAGLSVIQDRSIRRPPAPPRFTVQENENRFVLSWMPCGGPLDSYEVCYDEHENSTISIGKNITTIELGSPRVISGKIYSMKVRGINKGGVGEWSNTVVGQFAKPFPQKPEILDLFLYSTIAVITVKISDTTCKTESPVNCVEISYIHGTCKEWSKCRFEIESGKSTYKFTIKSLQPDSTYSFHVKSKNAEGWSMLSNLKRGDTLKLPLKPAKPDPPVIKVHSTTKVDFKVKNVCSKISPIVAWKVIGCNARRNENVEKYYELNAIQFDDEIRTLLVTNLDPNQKYTLQLLAKNENGWSEPSNEFTIHIITPPTPKNVRVSSKRSHSLIKIRWNPPDSDLITHYEVMKRMSKGYYNEKPIKVPVNKLSVTFTKLKHKTYYCFKVRACNGLYTSNWSEEIETNTRIHKGIKAALSPVVWAVGTVASPVVMPLASGVATAVVVADEETSNKKSVAAAGTALTVGATAVGIVGAPLFGAGMAHAL